MIIEKFITIFIIILLNFLLVYRFIKRYAPENLFIVIISSFSFGSYLVLTINNIYIPILIQIALIILMFCIPLVFVLLQFNNIILKRKILYYKMKWNMYLQDYTTTKVLLYKLIEETGRKAEYYYNLGICYKHLKDYINSRDSFALAVELDKRHYLSFFELGCILDETNKKETAVIMFNNALRIKPDFYDAAESLGICYTSQSRYDDAIKVYQNALEYHPKSFELYYNMAMMQLEIGNYDGAENSFKKAADLRPKLYSAYYNIGTINYMKGEYTKAIEFFKLARSSTMYGGKAYYKLAIVYASNNEYEKSMSCLEYAIQIEPKYLKEAKDELVFENIQDRIIEYEKSLDNLQENYKYRNDYMKQIELEDKRKSLLEVKIAKDIEKEQIAEMNLN